MKLHYCGQHGQHSGIHGLPTRQRKLLLHKPHIICHANVGNDQLPPEGNPVTLADIFTFESDLTSEQPSTQAPASSVDDGAGAGPGRPPDRYKDAAVSTSAPQDPSLLDSPNGSAAESHGYDRYVDAAPSQQFLQQEDSSDPELDLSALPWARKSQDEPPPHTPELPLTDGDGKSEWSKVMHDVSDAVAAAAADSAQTWEQTQNVASNGLDLQGVAADLQGVAAENTAANTATSTAGNDSTDFLGTQSASVSSGAINAGASSLAAKKTASYATRRSDKSVSRTTSKAQQTEKSKDAQSTYASTAHTSDSRVGPMPGPAGGPAGAPAGPACTSAWKQAGAGFDMPSSRLQGADRLTDISAGRYKTDQWTDRQTDRPSDRPVDRVNSAAGSSGTGSSSKDAAKSTTKSSKPKDSGAAKVQRSSRKKPATDPLKGPFKAPFSTGPLGDIGQPERAPARSVAGLGDPVWAPAGGPEDTSAPHTSRPAPSTISAASAPPKPQATAKTEELEKTILGEQGDSTEKKFTFTTKRNSFLQGSSPPTSASMPAQKKQLPKSASQEKAATTLPQWAQAPDAGASGETIDWDRDSPFAPMPTGGSEEGPSKGPSGGHGPKGFGEGWGQVFRGGRIFEPLMQRSQSTSKKATLPVAERDLVTTSFLELESQQEQDVAAARSVTLPPFQSVIELTTAWKPPVRTGEETEEIIAEQAMATGMSLPEGSGLLADGTTYSRVGGEEFGVNGRWHRWTSIKGETADGTVSWEETWWETSDWSGFKELGSLKMGTAADGSAWRETWREVLTYDAEAGGEPFVERSANKRATDETNGTEWEEKWGEKYWVHGRVEKFADKWGREGPHIWHEKWGEHYDGEEGVMKYTDKWAERTGPDGVFVESKWGDKWEENFKWGKGERKGETWSEHCDGGRYNRYWGEKHYGEGWVQKYGHSTTGEHWDTTEQSGTHYNPIPHFNYNLALRHSPTLLGVPVLPRDGATGELSDGVASL